MHYSDRQYFIAVMLSTIFACADDSTKDHFTEINILANKQINEAYEGARLQPPQCSTQNYALGFSQSQSRASTPILPRLYPRTPSRSPIIPLCVWKQSAVLHKTRFISEHSVSQTHTALILNAFHSESLLHKTVFIS